MNTCITCQREYEYSRAKGHKKNQCNSCSTNIRRFKVREQILEVMGRKCSICNYDKCITALECHHKDSENKDFNLSGAHSRSWTSIKAELEKCIMVCANCHREIHAELIKIN